MFVHWLLSLLICAGVAVYLIFPDFFMGWYNKLEGAVGTLHLKIIGAAILAVYVIIAIVQVCLIFKRGKRSERGFITVDSSDTGRTRIAISAIEQMVRQSVHSIDGISDMKISIDNQDDAIVIRIIASILNGCHVPTITMNMQNAIRKFVEMNCGVAVRQVLISINAVTNPAEAPKRRKLLRGKQVVPSVTPAVPAPEETTEPAPQPEAPAYTPYAAPEPEEAPAYQPYVAPEPVKEEPVAGAEPEVENTFHFDPDYKPTLVLDPFGAQEAEEGEAKADEENDEDLL